jgi:hypothetical protein
VCLFDFRFGCFFVCVLFCGKTTNSMHFCFVCPLRYVRCNKSDIWCHTGQMREWRVGEWEKKRIGRTEWNGDLSSSFFSFSLFGLALLDCLNRLLAHLYPNTSLAFALLLSFSLSLFQLRLGICIFFSSNHLLHCCSFESMFSALVFLKWARLT